MESTTGVAAVLEEHLLAFIRDAFAAAGLPQGDAQIAAEALVDANLRGVDTHGVGFLPLYIRCIGKSLINPTPDIQVDRCGQSLLRVHGDNGEGHVVAGRVIREAVAVAQETGTCTVTVRDTNHVGMLAHYVEFAATRGLVAHAMTSGEPWMAPWGGKTRVLSTNPVAWAIPAGKYAPVVLDMATSVVAMAKIVGAARLGEPIPAGWALDRDGLPTIDPSEVMAAGSVLPLGEYKGYGLSLVVDLLAGVMSGGAFSTDIRDLDEDRPQGVGCSFTLLDVARLLPIDDFLDRVDEAIRRVKASELAPGSERILYPGELEAETRVRRRREGIPLPVSGMPALVELADALGIQRLAWSGQT